VVDGMSGLAPGLAVGRDDRTFNRAVGERYGDEPFGGGLIDRGWAGVSGFVVLLHLDQPLNCVCGFIVFDDPVMDVAHEEKVVEPVPLLVRLLRVIPWRSLLVPLDVTDFADNGAGLRIDKGRGTLREGAAIP